MADIQQYSEQTFESIKHINEYGQEFWYARELARVLEYKDFRNFEQSIFKAMDACKNSGYDRNGGNRFGCTTWIPKLYTFSICVLSYGHEW